MCKQGCKKQDYTVTCYTAVEKLGGSFSRCKDEI